MEIIKQTKDFRNWDLFLVKGIEEVIEKYFNEKYPNNDVSILEHLNNMGTFDVYILPK